MPGFASSFPPAKLYGFPIGFVTYYLPPDGTSGLMPPLSSLAVRVPQFLANATCYFVIFWIISKVGRRRACSAQRSHGVHEILEREDGA